MSSSETCPAHNQLVRFVRGQLPEPEITNIERHVEDCPHCGDTLAGLQRDDTGILDSIPADADPEEDTDRRLVTELVQQMSDWRPLAPWPAAAEWTERFERKSAGYSELEGWLKRVLRPAEEANEIGRLGPFVLRRILGVGGMGVVCEADDPGLKRKVAIKILKPELAANDVARRRFVREAQAAAAIEHSNVVAIHHVGEDCGVPYFAMTLLSGVTLQDYVASCGPLSERTVLSIARQVVAGLAAAHCHGLIHRDIKPANIFLVHHAKTDLAAGGSSEAGTRHGDLQVKLLDFGLARGADEDTGITDPGTLAGTPSYMSPEQARGLPLDHRSDLFSLGCVLYWMTSGQGPFGGPNTTASLLAVLQHCPATPASVNPAVSKTLSNVIMKLLEKDPGQRYQSAAEVVAALNGPTAAVSSARKISRPAKWIGVAAIGAGLVAVAAIIHVLTGKGTLILEVNEPDVKVSVDGAHVEIQSPRESITVAVGDHELEVTKDGFTSYTKRFVVKRGGKLELTARLEPLPTGKDAAPSGKELAELTIEVPATRQWTATGVMLSKGMELQVTASGNVDAAPESESREYYQQVPPIGRQERLEHFPAAKLPGLCLVGRIGNGPTFYVGEQFSFMVTAADTNGELYLGINDDLVDDNFGAWKVKIKTHLEKLR